MFKKLRTVIYHTENLPQAKNWYTQLTGVEPYFDMPFYVGFNINGFELGLDPDMSGIERGNQSVAYWNVDEIEACVSDMVKNGAVVKDPVKEVGEGIKVAVLSDPFGNSVGLIEEV